jgi:hypothetical protein
LHPGEAVRGLPLFRQEPAALGGPGRHEDPEPVLRRLLERPIDCDLHGRVVPAKLMQRRGVVARIADAERASERPSQRQGFVDPRHRARRMPKHPVCQRAVGQARHAGILPGQ